MVQQEIFHGGVTSLKDAQQFRQGGLPIPERLHVDIAGDTIRSSIASLVNGVDWWSEVFYQTSMYETENPKTKERKPSRVTQQIAEFAKITGKKLNSSEIRLVGGFEVYRRLGALITEAKALQFSDTLSFQEFAKEEARIETLTSYQAVVKKGLDKLVAKQRHRLAILNMAYREYKQTQNN